MAELQNFAITEGTSTKKSAMNTNANGSRQELSRQLVMDRVGFLLIWVALSLSSFVNEACISFDVSIDCFARRSLQKNESRNTLQEIPKHCEHSKTKVWPVASPLLG